MYFGDRLKIFANNHLKGQANRGVQVYLGNRFKFCVDYYLKDNWQYLLLTEDLFLVYAGMQVQLNPVYRQANFAADC